MNGDADPLRGLADDLAADAAEFDPTNDHESGVREGWAARRVKPKHALRNWSPIRFPPPSWFKICAIQTRTTQKGTTQSHGAKGDPRTGM